MLCLFCLKVELHVHLDGAFDELVVFSAKQPTERKQRRELDVSEVFLVRCLAVATARR